MFKLQFIIVLVTVIVTLSANVMAKNVEATGPIFPELQNCDALLSPLSQEILRLPKFEHQQPYHDKSVFTPTHEEVLHLARTYKLNLDFKELADLKPLPLSEKFLQEMNVLTAKMNDIEKTKFKLDVFFDWPRFFIRTPDKITRKMWHMPENSPHAPAFNHIEGMWKVLTRRTHAQTNNSLIPLPYPFVVSGERFREQYYWDTYFGIQGLLVTGRLELAQMQVENLLHLVRQYGFVPNGNRTYYLTRSQPPLLSSMVKDVYLASLSSKSMDPHHLKKWLKQSLELLLVEYRFWMSPQRFDKKTGLNHHWDKLNKTRPERWGQDDENHLGKTYRDVRAEAESGADFTATFEGKASQVAPILLNSVLYKMEQDIVWMIETLTQGRFLTEASDLQKYRRLKKNFEQAAELRLNNINKYMWNEDLGIYQDYQLVEKRKLPYIKADNTAALFAKVASPAQALSIKMVLDEQLMKKGGLVATNIRSKKQWDDPYAWATHQLFYVKGSKNYRNKFDKTTNNLWAQGERELALRWTQAIDNIFLKHGAIYEKINGETGELPIDLPGKYPNQKGFLWTNSVYLWFLIDTLGVYPTQIQP